MPVVLERFGDYSAMFPRVFAKISSVEVMWDFFDVVKAQAYPSLEEIAHRKYDGIVMTGSSASAYQDLPWIHKLIDFVALMRTDTYRTTTRIIGVCFGHQILAMACGGICERNEKGWERIDQVHRDHVPYLPPGFVNLGKTASHTPIHSMISVDNQCITIQGHPEYTRDTTRLMLSKRIEMGVISAEQGAQLLHDLDTADPHADNLWLVDQFIKFLQGHITL
ncbi:class I glutamine amidotransferase-like protein [Spinellus fusiger]|nr:class I glutamine amidotransferase-like protein [Spinellus fusiger]